MAEQHNSAVELTGHYVNKAAFDPESVQTLTPEQERYYQASQWRIMWWRFKRHRLALISGLLLIFIYVTTAVSDFIAPYDLHSRHIDQIYAPPQPLHFFHEGKFIGPFVYRYDYRLNMENLRREYTENRSVSYAAAILMSSWACCPPTLT
jgi:peptide/nickel transport system permease protein